MAEIKRQPSPKKKDRSSSKEEGESARQLSAELSPRGESEIDKVTLGVIWVKKAKAGSDQWVDECSEEQLNSYLLAKRMKVFGFIAKYGLVLLPFFDQPAKCIGTPENCATLDRHVYAIGFPRLPEYISLILAIILYTIIICRMNLRRWAMGSAYHFHGWNVATSIFVGLGLLTTVLCFIFPNLLAISIIFRPLVFIGRSKNLRTGVLDIVHALPGFVDVLFSFMACVAIFVWIGMVMFPGTSEGTIDFYSWGDGFAKLWTGYTTANSPNFYIPALNQNRWYFIFFFIYMIFTLFLLSNVLLAKVYDSYKDSLKDKYNKIRESQEFSSDRSFTVLADPATNLISVETWEKLSVAMFDPYMGLINVGNVEDVEYNKFRLNVILTLFYGIDVKKMGSINRPTWKRILGVIFDRDLYIPTRRPPRIGSSPVADFFTTGTDIGGVRVVWDKVMDSVILVGTCITFWESVAFAEAKNPPNLMDEPTYWFLFCFSVFYFVGLNTKIFVLGLERFWYRKPLQHRFDLANVYLLLIMEILYMSVWHSEGCARMVILLHMCRALRLFVYITPLAQLFTMVRQLIPTFRQTLMILLVVYYIFSVIGSWCFGGMIYTTNPALTGTGFAEGLYWSLTFNDILSGMITLFLVMLVNNWYIVADGYMLASGTIWCGAFFFTWYVIANFVMINIVVAVILDGTGVISEMNKKQEEERTEMSSDQGISKQEMLQNVAGDHSAEFMLRQILDEEDDVFAAGAGSPSAAVRSHRLSGGSQSGDGSPSPKSRRKTVI